MDNFEENVNYPSNPHDLDESPQHENLHDQNLSNPQDNNFVDNTENGDDCYDTEETEDDDDRTIQDADLERQEKKKRKLKALLSNYVLAPRAVVTPSPPKSSRGGRNSLTDWTEQETNVLLDAWGERFLKHNRKSVRSEEWHEVAEKVSEGSKIKRTETQCRNRLDTLKKKYKKEKAMLAEGGDFSSKWVYFSKMDMYLTPSSYPNLPNGDVSVTSKVVLNGANSSDDTEFAKGESDNLENLDDFPPKKAKINKGKGAVDPFKFLADSIDKFSDMYEKIESSKSKQLVELENMRMEFERDLELEKRKILERTQVEIAKIWGHIDENDDLSPNNASG